MSTGSAARRSDVAPSEAAGLGPRAACRGRERRRRKRRSSRAEAAGSSGAETAARQSGASGVVGGGSGDLGSDRPGGGGSRVVGGGSGDLGSDRPGGGGSRVVGAGAAVGAVARARWTGRGGGRGPHGAGATRRRWGDARALRGGHHRVVRHDRRRVGEARGELGEGVGGERQQQEEHAEERAPHGVRDADRSPAQLQVAPVRPTVRTLRTRSCPEPLRHSGKYANNRTLHTTFSRNL